MSKADEKKQNNADKTREKILQAALKLFVDKGYAGTSMGKIAAAAQVPSSLIYHHFANKETLWKRVKTYLFDDYTKESSENIPTHKGLHTFLERIAVQRASMYEDNQDMMRMLVWQALEDQGDTLLGSTKYSPNHWAEMIETLQKQGEIRTDLSAKLIMLTIVGTFTPITTNFLKGILKTKKEKTAYINTVIDTLEAGLQPQNL